MLSFKRFNSKKLRLIGLGCDYHFRLLQSNIEKLKKEKSFWVYDKAKLDIAFFLANHHQKLANLTYITSDNFETIEINEKPESERVPQKDKVLDFIHNYEFTIIDSFSNPHPFEAYALICRYMNAKAENQLKSIFRLSFSQHPIKIKGSFLPKMDELRKSYLNTQGLKLRVLERKRDATKQEIHENIEAWKKHFQIEEILSKMVYSKNQATEEEKENWMVQNNYGWEVQQRFIMQGFGRKFSSFSFKR